MTTQSTLLTSSLNELATAMQPPNAPPPEIRYRHRDWIHIEHPTNSKKGSRQSRAWGFGDHYIAVDNPDQST
jgi:hypothetical protein